jgi:hypothetical protein
MVGVPLFYDFETWALKADQILTAWCRTLFEKLIVTQLVKNILLSLWNPKFH